MSISHTFGRCTAWIVDRPALTVLLLICMSSLAGVGYYAPERVLEFFKPAPPPEPVAAPVPAKPAPPPAVRPRPNVESFDLTRSDAILVIESDDIFTPSGATALRHMVSELEELPYVRNIVWMDRVPVLNIFGLNEPLFPKSQASAARFAAARDKAMRHPLVKGQLLSPDGRTLIVLVNFNWLHITSDDDCSLNLKKSAEAALAKYPDVKFDVGVTGNIPIRLMMMQAHERDNVRFRVIGYSMAIIMAAVLFRGVSSIIIVALGPALGIFWTIGFLRFFDVQNNPFNTIVLPVLLSLVGLADGVHLMVQMRRFRGAGMTYLDAARAGLEEVGLACFLTAITTSVGFWSLSLAQHQIVREFGWSCVLGVLVTVIAVLTIIPLAFWGMGQLATRLPARIRRMPWLFNEQTESVIENHLHRFIAIVDFVLKRPRTVAWVGIVVTLIGAVMAFQLRPDERRSSFLPESAEVTKALHKMDKALGGLEFSEVRIEWTDKVASDSEELLKVISQVDDVLKTESLIGTPISIRNFLDALPGDSPTEERASMLELLPPPLKRAFYKPEDRTASVTFRVQDIGIAQYTKVFERVDKHLREIVAQHPQFKLELEGAAIWRWKDLFKIVEDLGSSLGSETFIIICILGVVFRSVRIGLMALVPNIFPLVMCGAWMYLSGQPLEMASVCCFTICLGIAVDDTIHFLTRFQEELPRSRDRHDAIRNTFQAVGTSMIMTAMVLIVGLFTVTFSDMHDQRVFGRMGVMTMVTAMIGDLVILPAILSVYALPTPAEAEARKMAESA